MSLNLSLFNEKNNNLGSRLKKVQYMPPVLLYQSFCDKKKL